MIGHIKIGNKDNNTLQKEIIMSYTFINEKEVEMLDKLMKRLEIDIPFEGWTFHIELSTCYPDYWIHNEEKVRDEDYQLTISFNYASWTINLIKKEDGQIMKWNESTREGIIWHDKDIYQKIDWPRVEIEKPNGVVEFIGKLEDALGISFVDEAHLQGNITGDKKILLHNEKAVANVKEWLGNRKLRCWTWESDPFTLDETKVTKIEDAINKFKSNMKLCGYDADISISPKASKSDIAKAEENLNIKIPSKLKNYYLNEGNGVVIKTDYNDISTQIEILSCDNILGLHDFYTKHWKTNEINHTDEEIDSLYENNQKFFIWSVGERDGSKFAFAMDKEGYFYCFYVEDCYKNESRKTPVDIVNSLINAKDGYSVERVKNLVNLFDGFLLAIALDYKPKR